MNTKLIEEIRGLAMEIMNSIDDYEDSLKEDERKNEFSPPKKVRHIVEGKEVENEIIEKLKESQPRHIEVGYYDLDDEFVYTRLIVWNKEPQDVINWIGRKFGYHGGNAIGKIDEAKMYWMLWCRREDADDQEIRVLVMEETDYKDMETNGYIC